MDFEAELTKLLAQEPMPLPQSEFTELSAVGNKLLQTLDKRQVDISLQIEELYDLARESDNTALQEVMQREKTRADSTIRTAVGLSDLIDDFYEFSLQSGNKDLEHQAHLMRKKADGLLAECGITRLGETGQPLDPEIHSVKSGITSVIPREHVAKVLQSGYRYQGALLRKAAIVVSKGPESSCFEFGILSSNF